VGGLYEDAKAAGFGPVGGGEDLWGRPDEGAWRKDIYTIRVIQVSGRQWMGRPYVG